MQSGNVKLLEAYFNSNKIFERFGLSRIGIFGSFARGENYKDIDLLLEENIAYEKRMQLKQMIEKDFKVKVDVVIKQFAEPIVLHRALKDMYYATFN